MTLRNANENEQRKHEEKEKQDQLPKTLRVAGLPLNLCGWNQKYKLARREYWNAPDTPHWEAHGYKMLLLVEIMPARLRLVNHNDGSARWELVRDDQGITAAAFAFGGRGPMWAARKHDVPDDAYLAATSRSFAGQLAEGDLPTPPDAVEWEAGVTVTRC